MFNLYLRAVSSIYCTFNSVLLPFCYLIAQIEHLNSCNLVERAGIEPATLTRVRPAFPLSYLPIYPLIAGIARPAHTTPRKGITHLSLSCILQAHTWCVLRRCRQFKPDFYIPLLARGFAHELALARVLGSADP